MHKMLQPIQITAINYFKIEFDEYFLIFYDSDYITILAHQ